MGGGQTQNQSFILELAAEVNLLAEQQQRKKLVKQKYLQPTAKPV